MHLKSLLTCSLFLGVVHTARAATFDLGSHGLLSLDIPASWTANGRPLGDQGFDLRLRPQSGSSMQINFTVIFPPPATLPDVAPNLL
jgi:hypothetical protein